MAYAAWSVIAGEQPTTSKWNILGSNDSSFNDGSGLAFTTNNVVPANALATNAISLGYAQITSNFSTSNTTPAQVTGLTLSVTIPAGSRKIGIIFHAGVVSATANIPVMTIWDGTVGSGTQLDQTNAIASQFGGFNAIAVVTPAAGSKTYNAGLHASAAGTAQIGCSTIAPSFIIALAL